MNDLRPAARLPLLFLGMISLLAGVVAGLARLAWDVPPVAAAAAGWLTVRARKHRHIG